MLISVVLNRICLGLFCFFQVFKNDVFVRLGRMLYWTDWGKKPRIESAWMDGQHREVLVNEEELGWPTGLVVDYLNGNRIYWCDAKENIIESIKPDGSERKIIISGGGNS